MSTELWQRLRAARKFGKKSQMDIATAMKLSRNAITLWESENPSNRTTPSLEQLKLMSHETGAALSWLMEDGESLDPMPISNHGENSRYPILPPETRVSVIGVAVMEAQGSFQEIMDDPEGNGYALFDSEPELHSYFLRVRGPGCTFMTRPGWYILLSPYAEPESDDQVIVRFENGNYMAGNFVRDDGVEYHIRRPDGLLAVLTHREVDWIHPVHGTMSPKQIRRDP